MKRVVKKRILVPFVLVSALVASQVTARGADRIPEGWKPRVVVMTDIGGDPDDRQSLVRFLLYTCDLDVEGLCTGFGHGHYENTRPDLLHEGVDEYAKVLPNLRKHRSDYPSSDHLRSLIKDGHNGDPHSVGPGMDSEASEWIIRVLDRDDPRPVWFSIWGGPRELAQAIWKVGETRTRAELAALKAKILVHSIADQDRTAGWVKEHHPDVFWIFSNRLFRGIWKDGNQDIVSPGWLEKNVRTDHGPLGEVYPAKAAGKDGVKEGDTPSFFYVLPNGLSDPAHPGWGGWGGRFRRSGRGNEYIPAEDIRDGTPDLLYTIHRWRRDYQNEFEARMDWCVKPYGSANHAPRVVLEGDRTVAVLEREVNPDSEVKLDARGSSDPDGHGLSFRWWVYREAGSYWAAPQIRGSDGVQAVVKVPTEASGRTVHVIVEATDEGAPPLTACRRMVLSVRGDRVAPPPEAAFRDPMVPVTKLGGPTADTGPWRFYRGVNINGKPVKIDGNRWVGDDAPGFECRDRAEENLRVALLPPTDPSRERMVRTFRWSRNARLALTDVPNGTYAVYAYVWEETSPTTFTIRLEGRPVATDFDSGSAGRWRRLGPWMTDADDGRIVITASGGDANFSGIEVWRKVSK